MAAIVSDPFKLEETADQRNYRKALDEIDRLRAELAEAYRLRDAHHTDAINARLELEELRDTNETLRKRVGELEAALEHNNSALEGANAIIEKLERGEMIDTFERWKRCPSTHCERRGECASPHECIVKPRPPELKPAKDARIAELEAGWETAETYLMKAIARAEQAEAQFAEAKAEREQIELANKEFGDQLAHAHVQLAEAHTELALWRKHSLHAELAKAKAERDAMRELLSGIQWAGHRFKCVVCEGQPSTGHLNSCRLAAALAPSPVGNMED